MSVLVTQVPDVTLQGVLSPKDARSAVDVGVDGLVLSNHGGRQLDHSPAPLDMIASVRRAIGHRVPLLMDGGIRRGTDVLKVGVSKLGDATEDCLVLCCQPDCGYFQQSLSSKGSRRAVLHMYGRYYTCCSLATFIDCCCLTCNPSLLP